MPDTSTDMSRIVLALLPRRRRDGLPRRIREEVCESRRVRRSCEEGICTREKSAVQKAKAPVKGRGSQANFSPGDEGSRRESSGSEKRSNEVGDPSCEEDCGDGTLYSGKATRDIGGHVEQIVPTPAAETAGE